MKNFLFIILFTSIIFAPSQTNAAAIETSHCNDLADSALCVQKTYTKAITIQNTLIKNTVKNGAIHINNIDTFIKKHQDSVEKINRLATRIINEKELLGSSQQDERLLLLFDYMLYNVQYISIEQAHAAIDTEKVYKLDLPNIPKDIGDYLAIIGYLAEEEIGQYINDLEYNDKEKLAKKITLTNNEIITYFSFEERDVSNANAIEKNVYYRLLIFYEYLEQNPDVWEEYKAQRNQK